MKKPLLLSVAFLALLSAQAFAADNTTVAPSANPSSRAEVASGDDMQPGHKYTLEEARKYAHERADKLDKMTPEEFAAKQERKHEWREKWKAMTPQEKEAFKEKHKAERAQKMQSATPSTTTGTPPSIDPIR